VKTSAASAETAVEPTASAAEATAKMDFLIMFIPLMFFAAAKRAATFTPTPSQEEILAGARGSVGDPGNRARSYAVDQGPDLGLSGDSPPQHLRQFRNIRRDPPRLIAREQTVKASA
jgi:hypothetical protein